MMKWFYIPLYSLSFLALATSFAFAKSDYVLPYPSAMPGNFLYKINLVKEQVLSYWYFGNFGQFKYNLREADKYLVEAKTLFEYEQYLLGFKALKKSDFYFNNVKPSLVKAQAENKNITEIKELLKSAALKHIEILKKILGQVPESFAWRPEKSTSTFLYLKKAIEESIVLRNKVL